MNNYKKLELINNYKEDELKDGFMILRIAGIIPSVSGNNIILEFDIVNIRLLENQNNNICNDVINELLKIRSFSTSNGKIVFCSYNKDRKTKNKTINKNIRIGYEQYKIEFSKENTELENDLLDNIYCSNSLEFLRMIPENTIDLIFTSPPYNFGIEYNSTDDSNNWKKYFDKLFEIFNECIRILKNGGRIIVNVQPLFSDYIPSHHIISNFFFNKGLIWKGEILWEKNNYNCKYCTWGSWKSPSSPYLKYSWEFKEIFCKNSIKKEGGGDNIDISAEEFKQWVYSKWSIAPERKMKQFGHDAMFPEELAKRIIKLFSYKNDIVLDPFNGVGTTTKVAKDLNRRFIGIDIDCTYCDIARKRLNDSLF